MEEGRWLPSDLQNILSFVFYYYALITRICTLASSFWCIYESQNSLGPSWLLYRPRRSPYLRPGQVLLPGILSPFWHQSITCQSQILKTNHFQLACHSFNEWKPTLPPTRPYPLYSQSLHSSPIVGFSPYPLPHYWLTTDITLHNPSNTFLLLWIQLQ